MSLNTAVCIATLKEAATIGPLVAAFRAAEMEVYVVDNGSLDGTVRNARLAGAHAVSFFSLHGGIGPCLIRAWRWALAMGHDSILQIDAGGSHDPADAGRLLAEGAIGVDLVVGSRFLPGSVYHHLSPVRPALSKLASRMLNTVHGSHYSDWTSGYRFFSKKALDTLINRNYRATMHGWQIEVLAYASEAGLDIGEVPISYTAGRSSFNVKVAAEALLVWSHILGSVGWPGSKLAEESPAIHDPSE